MARMRLLRSVTLCASPGGIPLKQMLYFLNHFLYLSNSNPRIISEEKQNQEVMMKEKTLASRFLYSLLIFFFMLWCFNSEAAAAHVSKEQAGTVALNWYNLFKTQGPPLPVYTDPVIKKIYEYKDANEESLFYVINLKPKGFVIVPGDNLLEPVTAFSMTGHFKVSGVNYLKDIVTHDIGQQMVCIRTQQEAARKKRIPYKPSYRKKIQDQWNFLLRAGKSALLRTPSSRTNYHWVNLGIMAEWGQRRRQSATISYACFNFYTPTPDGDGFRWDPGNRRNMPAGCGPIAMAQLMHYHQYPDQRIGTQEFTITVQNRKTAVTIGGGDDRGGPYDWPAMPFNTSHASKRQRMAVGALCRDAGFALRVDYTPDGTSAYPSFVADRMENIFHYANARDTRDADHDLSGTEAFRRMVHCNIDAGYPVLLSLYSVTGNHLSVCDGYQYIPIGGTRTTYYHLHFGNYGYNDAWYRLPTGEGTLPAGCYSRVRSCVYNIFPRGRGRGEIISGRVTDENGRGLKGYLVKVTRGGTSTIGADKTDDSGIYGVRVPGGSRLDISVLDPNTGSWTPARGVETGTSQNKTMITGNRIENFTIPGGRSYRPVPNYIARGSHFAIDVDELDSMPEGHSHFFLARPEVNFTVYFITDFVIVRKYLTVQRTEYPARTIICTVGETVRLNNTTDNQPVFVHLAPGNRRLWRYSVWLKEALIRVVDPLSARPGDLVTIEGEYFGTQPTVYLRLRSETNGIRCEIRPFTISFEPVTNRSLLQFYVPANTPAGNYGIIVDNGTRSNSGRFTRIDINNPG